jgi:hypothetical protein
MMIKGVGEGRTSLVNVFVRLSSSRSESEQATKLAQYISGRTRNCFHTATIVEWTVCGSASY